MFGALHADLETRLSHPGKKIYANEYLTPYIKSVNGKGLISETLYPNSELFKEIPEEAGSKAFFNVENIFR